MQQDECLNYTKVQETKNKFNQLEELDILNARRVPLKGML